jgi:isocitrate dehydrogenase
MNHDVVLIHGDGIGPEVVGATKKIIDAAGVKITWHECEAGARVFKSGEATGVPRETFDAIEKYKVALKGPLETPIGFGEKSANVTLRKYFETYGNIRPVKELPGIETPYSGMGIDLVIVRENVEDLYAGIEHMQTPNVAQCLKLISRKGSAKINRLAFEYARSASRKTVACATKANIMKLTEGLFKRVFEEVATEYSGINSWHVIVDNCAHLMVKDPCSFDVIVTTNMNGDILSDLGSALVGGLGLAPGANIGDDIAIFEAVHGSAPKHAGQDTANPTAVLLSGVMMLRHLGEFDAADAIEQALFVTMGHDHKLTRDIAISGKHILVGTKEFSDAIVGNLGKQFDDKKNSTTYKPLLLRRDPIEKKVVEEKVVGVDIFTEFKEDIEKTGAILTAVAEKNGVELKLISCRGVKVYPVDREGTQPDIVEHLRSRFVLSNEKPFDDTLILKLLEDVGQVIPWMHVEKLKTFDGENAFSKAHGEK